jgi:hypothetical protein
MAASAMAQRAEIDRARHEWFRRFKGSHFAIAGVRQDSIEQAGAVRGFVGERWAIRRFLACAGPLPLASNMGVRESTANEGLPGRSLVLARDRCSLPEVVLVQSPGATG